MSQLTVTFDTSCVISLLRLPQDATAPNELAALEQIRGWATDSRVQIFISQKSRTEALENLEKSKIAAPQNVARADKWLLTLKTLNSYNTTASRWIIGISRLGIDTVLGSDEEGQIYNDLSQFLFGTLPADLKAGDVFDLAILFEHYVQKNDLFVTRDRQNKMLAKQAELRTRWNIIVADPEHAVEYLRSRV